MKGRWGGQGHFFVAMGGGKVKFICDQKKKKRSSLFLGQNILCLLHFLCFSWLFCRIFIEEGVANLTMKGAIFTWVGAKISIWGGAPTHQKSFDGGARPFFRCHGGGQGQIFGVWGGAPPHPHPLAKTLDRYIDKWIDLGIYGYIDRYNDR